MTIAPESKTLVVPETGASIQVWPYHLPLAEPYQATLYLDDSQDEIAKSLRAGTYGLPPTYGIVQALVPPGGKILDMGAHIGTFTVTAATWGYEVLAVEASPTNATLLQNNIDANDLAQRAQVARTAVGDHVGSIEFVNAGPYGAVANSRLLSPTITVPITTGIKLLADKGWTEVDLVKLDVEGSEIAVLRAMAGLLSQPDAPPILVESNGHTLNFFDETPQHLLQQLESYGYRSYLLQDNQQLLPVSPTYCQPFVCVDYLAIKQPLPLVLQKQVVPALELIDLVPQLDAYSRETHPHLRMHVARALSTVPVSSLANQEIIDILFRLAQDIDQEVRAAAAWWHEGEIRGMSTEVMRYAISAQAAEINRLRNTPYHSLLVRLKRLRQRLP
jgi:FkbM family methyltransferase